MKTLLQTLRSFFCDYEPMRSPRWELVVMRVLFVMVVWDMHSMWMTQWAHPMEAMRLFFTNPFNIDIVEKTQPHPMGLGMVIDFSFLSIDSIERTLRLLTAISLVLYAVGLPTVFTLAIPLFFNIGIGTLKNSQGAIGHTAQVTGVVLLCVWLAGAWTWHCRRIGRPLAHDFSAGEFEASWARASLAATYVVSGITKIIASKGAWIASTRFLPLHIVKNCDMEYYDTIKPEALKLDWLPQLLMDHPMLSIAMFSAGLPLELGCFLALNNRRAAAFFGIGLIVFHEIVTRLMNLSFIYNKALLLIFFVAPWWWVARMMNAKGKIPKAGQEA